MKRETLALAFALQDSDPEANTFRGMASVFNVLIDAWVPTRIMPGAFTKTLSENAKRVKVLYQHNSDWPIGLPTRMEETSDGLLVEAKVSQTTMGKEVLQLMRDGVLTELSIGFDPIKFEMMDEGAAGQVRHVKEIRLWEFSPVTFAANPEAAITSVNSLYSLVRPEALARLPQDVQAFLRTLADRAMLRETPDVLTAWQYATQTALEHHEGKVLSAKNKSLVKDAIDALQKLIDAAEPDDDKQARPLTTEIARTLAELDMRLMAAEHSL